MSSLPCTGRLGTSRNNYVNHDHSRNEYKSIVSPMSFDVEDVPCWNDLSFNKTSGAGGRIESARTSARIGSSSGMRGNQSGRSKHNQFLPGLDMSQPRHDGNPKISLFRENSRTSHVATGRRGFLESGNSTYRIEAHDSRGGGHIYPRNISTADPSTRGHQNDNATNLFPPIDIKNNKNNRRSNQPSQPSVQSTSSNIRIDNSNDLPIEPWAYKVMEKYNNPSVRPVSRTSSRISREELMTIKSSGGVGNEDDRREGLLRVKSLGRFKCT